MKIKSLFEQKLLRELVGLLLIRKNIRNIVLKQLDKITYKTLVETNRGGFPIQIQLDKYHYFMALLNGFDRAYQRGNLSSKVFNRFADVFVENVVLVQKQKNLPEKNKAAYPMFVLISPTGQCNLKCKGCYAASHARTQGKLDFATFDRILTEKRELWSSYFTVISGGEPLLWKDDGKDLLDMIAQHKNQLFLVYTNGTLITDEVAMRMAELGNITPAISVEGFQAETDARRGAGVHEKILEAFAHLRNHGVPFGVSTTPTRYNWRKIVSDEFVDFYFEEQGAAFCWLFQYMPIGREQSIENMVPAEERLEMFHRMNRLVQERKAFMADFWNSGPVSRGCISAGRSYGYFYVDWNGNVTPCSFVPYAAANIYDIFKSGGDLNTVLETPFFKRIRQWQEEYGYNKPNDQIKNWLAPCAIRDHFKFMKSAILETGAKPINKAAEIALNDENYARKMMEYDEKLEKLTRPVWKERYLNSPN